MGTNAGTISADVEIALNKLTGQISQVNTKLDNFSNQSKKRGKDFEKGWTSRFGKFNLAGVAAFTGVTAVVKGSISTFATFEQSIANVASVAGATGAELALLERTARQMGETTRFSATAAADALYNLASAGLDATQSTAALAGVLELAGATGSDLAFTSATLTSIIAQFGKDASEAGDISNTFAAAIANSQANMEKLSNAFRQVGPVAAGLGISLEETTGALQILFNAGFRGENAGLALKSALADLANTASPTNEKLKALGVNLIKLQAAETMAEKFGILKEAGVGVTEAIAAFGKEAGPQVITLINAGQEGIEKYTEAVTDTTKATELYAIQNDTLAGTIDSTKSAIEELAIGIGEGLEPALRPTIEAFKVFIQFLNAFPSSIKALVISFAGLATGLVSIGAAAQLVGIALPAAFGPIGLIVAGVVAGVVALTAAFSDTEQASSELSSTTRDLAGASKEYQDITKELEGDISKLTAAEKELLNIRKKELSSKVANNLSELAKGYDKTQRSIEKYKGKLVSLNKDEQKELAILARLTKRGIPDYGHATEKALIKIQKLRAEYTQEIVTSEGAIKEAILESAKAYNDGSISIGIYKDINTELYNEILNVAEQLKVQAAKQEEINSLTSDANSLSAARVSGLSQEAKELLKTIAAQNEYQEILSGEKDKRRENQAALLEEQGQIEEAYQIRKELLQGQQEAEEEALAAKFERIEESIEEESLLEEEKNILFEELEEKHQEELTAIKQNFADKQIDLNASKIEAIEAQENEHRDNLIAVGSSLYSGLKDVTGAYFDYKKSTLDQDSDKYKETARKQFNVNKAFQLVETGISGAQASVNAYKALSGIPYVGPALGAAAAIAAGAFAAIKIGFIAAKQPPAFETGGIVPGTSFSGDNVPIRANSGEAVLTREQQSRLLDLANGSGAGGAGGAGVLKIIFESADGLTSKMYEASRNGELKIEKIALVETV